MTMPEFVRQGLAWASPESDRYTEAVRMREESIMSFVAAWEAFNIREQDDECGVPLIEEAAAREVQFIARWAEVEFQTSYLRRLAARHR